MKFAGVVLAFQAIFLPSSLPAQQVQIYVSSNAGDRLARKTPAQFQKKPAMDVDFHIHEAVENQKILGFGASFLEAGAICLNALSAAQQDEVLRSLFDVERGAGFSAMKSTIAATDFASAGPWFSYDDVPGDAEMKHFTITRDLSANGVIPFIKRARKFGSFIIESPMDYPPDWMLVNWKVAQDQRILPANFPALARYYAKYIEEYKNNGIEIDYLSLFNEPGGNMGHSGYSGYARITYDEIGRLLKDHVVPLFDSKDLRTKFILSEASTREIAYDGYKTVLDDPAARKRIGAIAYHGYDFGNFDKIAAMRERYPDLPLWMTEICHFSGYSPHSRMPLYDFDDGEFWGNQIFSELEAGASGWTYWNMILDQTGGPWLISPEHRDPDKNSQHPVVIVDRDKKTVTYTGLYYYLAHFSKFIRPGSIRVETTGARNGLRCLTFKRPDGMIASELMNVASEAAGVVLDWHGRSVQVDLPGKSIATLLWKAND